MVEHAYRLCNKPLQTLVPFYKNTDRVDAKLRTHNSVPYVKLHGCISRRTDLSIPLILTSDQYVTHRKNRQMLFERVKHYASEYTLVFIGHSLEDTDLRQILLELSEEGIDRPRSYVVVPSFTDRQQRFWETKRITAIAGTFQDFLEFTDSTMDRALRAVVTRKTTHPLESHIVKHDTAFSEDTLALLIHDLTYVRNDMSSPLVAPPDFFRGMSLGWSPIQQDLDAHRTLTDSILSDCILVDEVDRPSECDLYLIKGHAGSGKTICLKRIAWDAAVSFDQTCLYYSGNGRIPYNEIAEISELINERIYLFVDRPVAHVPDLIYLIRRARRESMKLTIVCAERGNEWNMECRPLQLLLNESFDLRYLSIGEIRALLSKLEQHKSLGLLENTNQEEREKAFEQKAGRQLLVALHEATMGKSFHDIIFDEYSSIGSELARNIYLTICTLNRLDVVVRAGIVKRVHSVSFESFRDRFFLPLESVVQTLEYTHSQDRAYQARHPWIAEVVFERAATSPDDRYDLYIRILDALDIGYDSDRQAFRRLIRGRDLLRLFPDPVLVRNLFKKAVEMASDDAYVYQQQAIFEMRRENPNLSAAYELLTHASKQAPHDRSITHTLAELEIERSKRSNSGIEHIRHLASAKQLARSLTSREVDSSYGFHTLCKIGLDELQKLLTSESENGDEIEEAIKSIEKDLEAGLRRFPDDEYLLDAESRLAMLVRDDARAMQSLRRAFRGNPSSPFIAKGLARLYELADDVVSARSTLESCLDHRPGDKGTNAALARLIGEEFPDEGLRAEYHWRRAFTDGDGNFPSQFWYARQLYINGKEEDAIGVFRGLRGAQVAPEIRNKLRGPISGASGTPKRSRGRVERLEATYALVSQIEKKDWVILHRKRVKREDWNRLTLYTSLTYRIGFTYNGLAAFEIDLSKH